MRKQGFSAEERDLGTQPLSVAELESLIGKRDYKDFLNPRNELYRERGMLGLCRRQGRSKATNDVNPPARGEALKLMSENPNLIRRPILVAGQKLLIGFDEKVWKEL